MLDLVLRAPQEAGSTLYQLELSSPLLPFPETTTDYRFLRVNPESSLRVFLSIYMCVFCSQNDSYQQKKENKRRKK